MAQIVKPTETKTQAQTLLELQRKLALERLQQQIKNFGSDNEDVFEKNEYMDRLGENPIFPDHLEFQDIPKHEGHSSIEPFKATSATYTTPDGGLRWSPDIIGSRDIPFDSLSFSITWDAPTDPSILEAGLFHSNRPGLGEFHFSSDSMLSGSRITQISSIGIPRKSKQKPVTLTKYDLETVLDLNRGLKKTLKKQNKQFVEFKEKTDHWETTILTAFNNKTQSSRQLQQLGNSERCVMGATFNWNNDWHQFGDCGDCNWLGMGGLNMFTNFDERDDDDPQVRVTSRDGFEHYKALWEYHMNSEHYHK